MADFRNSVGYLQLRAADQARKQAIADSVTNQVGQDTDIGGKALAVTQGEVQNERTKEQLGPKLDNALLLRAMQDAAALGRQDKARAATDPLTGAKLKNYNSLMLRRADQTGFDERRVSDAESQTQFEQGPKFAYRQQQDAEQNAIDQENAISRRWGLTLQNPMAFGNPALRNWEAPSVGSGPNQFSEVPGLGPSPGSLAPLSEGPTSAPQPPPIETVPIDKTTYDTVLKNMGPAMEVSSAFKRGREAITKVPDNDFNYWSEPTEIKTGELPWVGKVGITVPGNLQLRQNLVDMGAEHNPLGRFVLNMTTGHAERGNQPEGTFQKNIEDVGSAKSAIQDLTSRIGVLRLGLQSTAQQDARIDKILGMANDKAFQRNKPQALKVLAEMEKEYNKLLARYRFAAKNMAFPLQDLPDELPPPPEMPANGDLILRDMSRNGPPRGPPGL